MSLTLLAAAALLLGLLIGSFLNVVLYRFGEERTVVWGRSSCRSCDRLLSALELVPVLSYTLLRGRCRWCGANLSLQYPLVELATGLTFALVTVTLAPALAPLPLLELALWLAAAALLILIFVYDLKTTYIPNVFVYPLIALAGLSLFVSGGEATLPTFAEIAVGPLLLLPFFVLWDLSAGRLIGLGDGKLALALGWLLGPLGGLSAVVFSFWIGALVVLLRMAFERLRAGSRTAGAQLGAGSEVAFGPFMVVAAALVFACNLSFLSVAHGMSLLFTNLLV
ncbi:hypothetical protein GVX82_01460 [Patescibacteria group bacterium]|jgi:leader peptidase (prepilin peptidase)/N-methyltransferase|nr:hypothetical protein [Patescibacteria group bacterium]